MWLGAHRPILSDFQIKQQLICVVFFAKAAEWRPLQVGVGWRAEIAVENKATIFFADVELICVRVEDFDPVLCAFSEWHTMPCIFMRAIFARLGFSRPAGHFKLRPARVEPRIHQAEFNLLHRRPRSP